MEIKHEIIRFNQLTKDSCNQEVLEYLNKEFSLIVMDPKERHYFDLEDSVNFFFKTRDEGINFVLVNMHRAMALRKGYRGHCNEYGEA